MSSQELVPAGSHTLVINEPDTQRAIMLMDSHDLEQAMAELRGEVLATFVYRPKGAKPQLTYAGVKEAARLYRNVHFGATAVPLPDGTWMITSYAHNLADNTRVDYPMPYPAFDPASPEQAIKFRASLSKSLRNALAAVLPVAYLQTMIDRWLGAEQGTPQRAQAARPAVVATAHKSTSAPVSVSRAAGLAGGACSAGGPSAAERSAGLPPPEAGGAQPCPAGPKGDASSWTQKELADQIRMLAGGEVKTLAQWQALTRQHAGIAAPRSASEMTPQWLLSLYQALRAQDLEEALEQAPDEEAVASVMNEALDRRERHEITMEQWGALCAAEETKTTKQDEGR